MARNPYNDIKAYLRQRGAETLIALGLTATATELNYTDGVTSNIQTQLDNKADSSQFLHMGG